MVRLRMSIDILTYDADIHAMIQRTTVRLSPELMRLAKRKAVSQGTTVTALIEEGLRRLVHEPTEHQPPRGRPVPVSREAGGLRPGIDLDRLDDLDREADVTYLGRSR